MALIKLAYLANVVILLPIAIPTLLRVYDTAQGRFAESAGWRVLVGALWSAILASSLLGLFAPLRFAPVLLIQIIYKSLWLAVYAAPRLVARRSSEIPTGIALSFIAIVLVYPFLIPWGALLSREPSGWP
jgi:hypothetical protein